MRDVYTSYACGARPETNTLYDDTHYYVWNNKLCKGEDAANTAHKEPRDLDHIDSLPGKICRQCRRGCWPGLKNVNFHLHMANMASQFDPLPFISLAGHMMAIFDRIHLC